MWFLVEIHGGLFESFLCGILISDHLIGNKRIFSKLSKVKCGGNQYNAFKIDTPPDENSVDNIVTSRKFGLIDAFQVFG